ncbi:MAG TPA: hypothetical protein DCZ95_17070 [Verrucomicrobia bacterium]|nr:MAG: hypothetical protein A2X46_09555 [Lentisphaerae bacterium GWF2_57_35]HBA85797.1 hypothetical protein [Verrucomicrobiota bacterium]
MDAAEHEQKPAPEAPEPKPRTLNRVERRERAALDVLRTLLRDGYADQFGAVLPTREELDISLSLKVRPGENWTIRFDPPVNEQMAVQLQEHQAELDIFKKGAAYCFRCDSSSCEHALPPTSLSVFRGYTSTGVAEWMDFAQALIEARDERVDRLFGKPPLVLARVQLGRDLKLQQLSSFGRASKTYAVLGQVVAGYYSLPSGGLPGRLAMTFQIVETRSAGGRFKLNLNILTNLPSGSDLVELLASEWEPSLARGRDMALREIEALELRVQRARQAGQNEEARRCLQQIPSILRRLSESLERGSRQGVRRTRHVEKRRQQQRPVHKAFEEAQAVKNDGLFFDERTEAFVVRGAQGRAHVFNAEGRHVTSFVVEPGEVELRLRKRRWRNMLAEEYAAFKELLKKHVPRAGGGGTTTGP